MRRNKKRINSILALIMSFAIAVSGFGVPVMGFVSAADEENTAAVEKTAADLNGIKAKGSTYKEKVSDTDGKEADQNQAVNKKGKESQKPDKEKDVQKPKVKKETKNKKQGKNKVKTIKDEWSKGPNPDHLKGPEKAGPYPVVSGGKADPYLGETGKSAMLRSAASGNRLRSPEQGAIELTKKAEPVPGKLNTFKVTLRMEATDKEQKNDIVLVIDTSGSMKDNKRMVEAKKAAKNFVNKLLDGEHPNTRIALVSFETDAHLKKNFTNYTNKQDLLNAIDGLYANGGTFTQGGIREASHLLNGSQADFKNIVLLSDGVPTFNYEMYDPDAHVIPGGPNNNPITERETGPNVPKTAFNYSETAGAGNSMWKRYKSVGSVHYYYNSGNCAIAEAGFAKHNAKVYTVAVNAGAQGNGVLEKTATPGCSYNTEDPTALNGIFGQIAASIASAMKNAKVTDPMGAGFEVKGGTASNVQVTQGSVKLNNNTISWDAGTLTNSVSQGSMTRYAEMTYEVVINDSILDVVSPADGNYNTNAGATVHYTDIDGNQQTKAFPEPKAKPLIIELHKKLLDFKGREIPSAYAKERKFNFNMKLKEDAGFNQDYLVPGNKSKVMVDLRIDKTYELKENSISGNPASNLSDYDSTVGWKTWDGTQSIEPIEGTYLDKFIVPRGGSENDPLNTKITVTNKEKKLGKLKLKKTFNPSENEGVLPYSLRSGLYRSTPKFKITVVGINPYGGDDEVYREVHELYAGQEKIIENLPYGHYTVSEPGHEPEPTFVDSDGVSDDGKVDLLINKKEASVEVINRPKDDDYDTEVTASKTWVNGPEADHKAPTFELYADGVLKTDADPTVTPENGTANKFTYKWTELQKYNSSGKEIAYTVKEKGVTADNKLVVNGHTYVVTQQGNDITNIYEAPTDGEVNVTKVWKDPEGKTIAKPKVNLTLYRKVEGGAEEKVPGAAVKVVDGTTTAAEWTGLETTDINGKPYKFIVKESFKNADDVNNGNWTLVESTDVVDGKATITNKAVTGDDNLGKLTVTKKPLVNGEGVKSAVRLRGTPVKFKFKVTGPNGYKEEFELSPTESKVLKGLYFGEYKVEETDSKGYTASYSVADGKVTLKSTDKEKIVEVTNTNGGEGTVVEKTVEKIWVNGPKPSVTIELWRKNNVEGSDKIDEKVGEFVVPEGASGNDLKKTFTKLAKHDPKGNEFEYYVKEDNVPANYTKSIEGLKVTNTYKIPTDGEVNVTKVWKDPDGKTIAKPEVNLTLYRKVEGGAEEKVPGADVKVVDGTTTAAEWTGLEKTDINGKPYKFIVKESFKNADDVNNGNWTLVESTDVVDGKATITNKAVTGDDNLGKLTVTKKPLVNGEGVKSAVRLRGTPVKFKFKVTGPNGYKEEFELSPTESKVLKGLYFGEYKVEETDSKGYTASYSVADGKVTLKSTDKEKTVEVTNTNGGAGTVVDVEATKIWKGGPKKDHRAIDLTLKRKSKKPGSKEEVVHASVEKKGTDPKFTYKWKNLAKHDAEGYEYVYSVEEPNVKDNKVKINGNTYKVTQSGNTITNTYVKAKVQNKKKIRKVKTGDDLNPGLYGGISIAATLLMALMLAVGIRRRKKHE